MPGVPVNSEELLEHKKIITYTILLALLELLAVGAVVNELEWGRETVNGVAVVVGP